MKDNIHKVKIKIILEIPKWSKELQCLLCKEHLKIGKKNAINPLFIKWTNDTTGNSKRRKSKWMVIYEMVLKTINGKM